MLITVATIEELINLYMKLNCFSSDNFQSAKSALLLAVPLNVFVTKLHVCIAILLHYIIFSNDLTSVHNIMELAIQGCTMTLMQI